MAVSDEGDMMAKGVDNWFEIETEKNETQPKCSRSVEVYIHWTKSPVNIYTHNLSLRPRSTFVPEII